MQLLSKIPEDFLKISTVGDYSCRQPSVHFAPNYNGILEILRNTNFEELKNLFDITQRLILEHKAEIVNASAIDWKVSSWTRSTLMHDQVDESKSTRLHRCKIIQEQTKDGTLNSKEFQRSTSYRELLGIDGEPIKFEWIFSGLTSLEILQKIEKNLQDQNIEHEHFQGRIIFMPMFDDIAW